MTMNKNLNLNKNKKKYQQDVERIFPNKINYDTIQHLPELNNLAINRNKQSLSNKTIIRKIIKIKYNIK